MSEPRHTPGPWRWWTSNSRLRLGSGDRDGNVLYAERLRDGADVVILNPADRPLIAAAPDMRAALVEAEAALSVKSSLRGAEQARVERALEVARAALARARGEEAGRG